MRRAQGNREWAAAIVGPILMTLAPAIAAPAQNQTPVTTLHTFDYTDGANSYAGLVQGTDGNLYGTTAYGGVGFYGTVFKINPINGTFESIFSFAGSNGKTPIGRLILATDGNLYGTTSGPGTNYGTAFKITSDGMLTTIHSFCSQPRCTDGEYPEAGLIQGADGNFYGTTAGDGIYTDGTVFKIEPNGAFTTLHTFCSNTGCEDGVSPFAALIQATDGNFYGTTTSGGSSSGCTLQGLTGCGTIFKITPSGTLTTLYNFCSQAGCADGAIPYAALLQGADGNFYGTTSEGELTVMELSSKSPRTVH